MTKTKIFATAWILAWAGALSAVIATAGVSGNNKAQSQEAPITAPQATGYISGATVRVVKVERTLHATTVQIEIDGRSALGDRVAFRGPAFLVDENGASHIERGGSIRGRVLSLRFDGSTGIPNGPAVLKLDGIGLTFADEPNPAPDSARFLPGSADLSLDLGSPAIGIDSRAVNASGPLSPGAVRLEGLERSGQEVLIRGHLEGFSRTQIQAASIGRSTLQLNDGNEVGPSGGRMGFGEDLSSFVLQYTIPVGDSPVALSVSLDVHAPPSSSLSGVPDVETLKRFDGNSVSIMLQ